MNKKLLSATVLVGLGISLIPGPKEENSGVYYKYPIGECRADNFRGDLIVSPEETCLNLNNRDNGYKDSIVITPTKEFTVNPLIPTITPEIEEFNTTIPPVIVIDFTPTPIPTNIPTENTPNPPDNEDGGKECPNGVNVNSQGHENCSADKPDNNSNQQNTTEHPNNKK